MEELIEKVAELVVSSKMIVVFTGAGASTESGIADFRSPGGVWEKYDPEDFYFQKFLASEQAREKYWQMSTEMYESLKNAEPNRVHLAIAKLEKLGKLDCVITQNIDGLHHKAGNSREKVIELHGTALSVSCLSCRRKYDRDEVQEGIRKGVKVPAAAIVEACSSRIPFPLVKPCQCWRPTRPKGDLSTPICSSLLVPRWWSNQRHPCPSMPSKGEPNWSS